ncbi:ATP-dependent protease [Vibrio sp. 10N.286.49.C2]|uniref:S16 family serine protease n=1 Tax=unclassified Vibrio TaxID=2614977 RepID=UPI000C853CE2|nr:MULTISPECIES: Lon protease family protein [unclassified Vibrio]PMH37148.1 ATP-dependent protease [Vibrio sp. 10N.286.49.C2]PMH57293.1 ATP-dependent protease [Vibrio sp. 10N.286.49.B1]PMH83423.1 ATP-dependent protease [Vibrio sp. 10N.286.48.B7]
MNQVLWQDVCPQYDEFQTALDNVLNIAPKSLFDLQPRLRQTVQYFASSACFSKVLVIKDGGSLAYRKLIADELRSLGEHVIVAQDARSEILFDRYDIADGLTHTKQGLIHQSNDGILLASANTVLSSVISWSNTKALLQGAQLEATPINALNSQIEQPIYSSDFKLIIIGDRDQLADFDYLEAEYRSGFMQYTELESDFKVNTDSIELYLGFVKQLVTNNLADYRLDTSAYLRLLQAGARETEDKQYVPLSLDWHLAVLGEASSYCSNQTISAGHIESAIVAKRYREAYLPTRAVDDILEGQVVIETLGEQVGQVNGLTVIDMPGHPLSYGEPARISCVVHFGDGDIADVERKVDLGGNIHAKGMMIMQAFVSSELNLDAPLPYSASIVFEQSYCEVDGDSASLAELCSLVSALSGYAIDQQIAVTGAVDQFGRVQAVGGLNEKVEGFYSVCKHQGFTGQHGVILPKTNVQHLALSTEVVESIKNGQFHIWAVSHVDEVIPLLLGKPFKSESEESVLSKIAERIENFEKLELPETMLEKIKNWFV